MCSIKNTLIGDQKLKLEGSSRASEQSRVLSPAAPLIDFFNSRASTTITSYYFQLIMFVKGLFVKG